MIRRLVQFSIRQRILVLVTTVALLLVGAYCFTRLPIEAYPDVMNTQVQVISQWPGHAAEEVEQQITVPLETSLNGIAHVSSLRSRSLFGLSFVYLTFEDGIDDYFAHQQVLERVTQATLPTNVQPSLSPIASATGEIYRYRLEGADVMTLKTLEDWVLEREFKSVPGVADVNSFGGTVKQYQVQIDPRNLKAYDVTLKNVTDALSAANANAGGSFVELGSEEYVVRGRGLFKSLSDIENVAVLTRNGVPLRVKALGTVVIGNQPRLGKVGWIAGGSKEDHDDAVEGIVLLRRDAAPDPTLQGIHKKVEELNHGILPKGIRVVPVIDRTDLVHTTSRTVEHNLSEGVVLVVIVLLLFLANVRAASIVAFTIPFGLLFAFTGMNLIHVPANLLSLGAVDFGVIVNGAVVLVENVYRKLAQRKPEDDFEDTIISAADEVQAEIFFTTLIIILAYLPLLTMQSVEQKMFAPMAYTIGLALIGSLIMALLVAPALCFMMLKRNVVDRVFAPERWLKRAYERALGWALAHPIPVVTGALSITVLGFYLVTLLGTEFLPHLDEGNLWIRASMPQTISYSEASKLMPKMRQVMAHFQPTRVVLSQLGRPDDGTDATGFYNAEFLVDLKPASEWKGFKSKEELVNKMNAELSQFSGVSFNFSQNIEDNVEEAVTGVKGELAVKLFGDDLETLEKKGDEISKVLSKVPGVVDLSVFHETGEAQLQITPDRTRIARYGLNVQDVEDVISTAIGGNAVTQVLNGEKKFDVVVRLGPQFRNDVDRIRDIRVSTPDNYRIPLSQLADVRVTRGASFVYREANRRFLAVKFGVRGRDLGGAVEEARRQVAAKVKLPEGYFTRWGGEFESLQRAGQRLAVITPVTLLMIFVVLYALFNKVDRALIVMMNVPLSLTGAVVSLYLTGFHLSVSAAVGFIALFGVAVQNGVIMISYFDHLREKGVNFADSVILGATTRLRPVLMTAMLASFGLIPAAISTGIGSDTQKPLAVAIVGGLTADVFAGTLFVLPVLYHLIAKARPPQIKGSPSGQESSTA